MKYTCHIEASSTNLFVYAWANARVLRRSFAYSAWHFFFLFSV